MKDLPETSSALHEAFAKMMLNQQKAGEPHDTDIEHNGTKIILPGDPDNMPLREAIATLERKAQDEETDLSVHEAIDAYPEDALYALNECMRQKYGWSSPQATPGFFGDTPPQLVTILTGPDEADKVQVPFGQFKLPGVENPINVGKHLTPSGVVLCISGTVKKREAHVLRELASMTRDFLKEHSLYKGKSIRLKVDGKGNMSVEGAPTFLRTDDIVTDDLILNDEELVQVRSGLWAPIIHTEKCIENGIPLNRGVLLEGKYGTGKTMTAVTTSSIAVENGWTFILLDDVRALKDALLFAQRYQPAIVFAEDVDRVAEERDQKGNDLLNVIDGALTKNSQVITVLTTNHVERLNPAMLRPGRLDAVITIEPPKDEAVERLIRLYGRGLVSDQTDLTEVSAFLSGNIAATVREVVERSKLAMISNGNPDVTNEDLMISARGMERHLNLLHKDRDERTNLHILGQSIVDVIKGSTSENFAAIQKSVDEIRENI